MVAARRTGGYAELTLEAPAAAARARPGQFVTLRVGVEPFWRRPYSISDAADGKLVLLVKPVGPGSRAAASLHRNEVVDLLGPLGRGFDLAGPGAWWLVGGGYGVAPLRFLARRLRAAGRDARVFLGGRCREDLLLRRALHLTGARLACATEDGGFGRRGRVTALLADALAGACRPIRIAACGPRGMLAEVARLAAAHRIPAQVSLEEVMACGIGVCNGCVVETRAGYQRVCREGPVFAAEDVVWHEGA